MSICGHGYSSVVQVVNADRIYRPDPRYYSGLLHQGKSGSGQVVSLLHLTVTLNPPQACAACFWWKLNQPQLSPSVKAKMTRYSLCGEPFEKYACAKHPSKAKDQDF